MKLGTMALGLLLLVIAMVAGCAGSDRAMVLTEDGVEAAAEQWDREYREQAALCAAQHEPETPEMETCFGDWYDADAKVAMAVGVIVPALRSYWLARAAGEEPPKSWAEIAAEFAEILADLPAPAGDVFDRVRGLR